MKGATEIKLISYPLLFAFYVGYFNLFPLVQTLPTAAQKKKLRKKQLSQRRGENDAGANQILKRPYYVFIVFFRINYIHINDHILPLEHLKKLFSNPEVKQYELSLLKGAAHFITSTFFFFIYLIQ